MHLVHQGTAEAERFPTSLESFKRFQSQLKENLEIPPKVETFATVESSSPASVGGAPKEKTPGFRPALSFPPAP
ncbi:MAG: hypothetical protein WDO17_09685 [Alphaproteobacteria bacterium]